MGRSDRWRLLNNRAWWMDGQNPRRKSLPSSWLTSDNLSGLSLNDESFLDLTCSILHGCATSVPADKN